MPIAAFVGPGGYGVKPDLRPRAPATVDIPTNARRRLSVGIERNPRPPICVVVLDEDGLPTAESLATARARGCLVPAPSPRRALSKETRDRLQAERPPQPPPMPEEVEHRRRWFTLLNSYFAGDATVVTPTISVPYIVRRITVSEESQVVAALPNSVIGAVEAGYDGNGLPVAFETIYEGDGFQGYASRISIRLEERASQIDFTPDVFIDSYPTRIFWLIRGSGVATTPVTMNIFIEERPDLLRFADRLPPEPPQARIPRIVNYPAPPSRLYTRGGGLEGEAPLSSLDKLELLAQRLRESPFGIPHSQFLAEAANAGFADAAKAADLAMRMAARPPNFALLARRLR